MTRAGERGEDLRHLLMSHQPGGCLLRVDRQRLAHPIARSDLLREATRHDQLILLPGAVLLRDDRRHSPQLKRGPHHHHIQCLANEDGIRGREICDRPNANTGQTTFQARGYAPHL
ncbi:hypothetical protein DC31_00085 [Microbacterium sp. CH12i]|nr:hypothetical protein DC31_00085 [Microbacterium sp. CH12i]